MFGKWPHSPLCLYILNAILYSSNKGDTKENRYKNINPHALLTTSRFVLWLIGLTTGSRVEPVTNFVWCSWPHGAHGQFNSR